MSSTHKFGHNAANEIVLPRDSLFTIVVAEAPVGAAERKTRIRNNDERSVQIIAVGIRCDEHSIVLYKVLRLDLLMNHDDATVGFN